MIIFTKHVMPLIILTSEMCFVFKYPQRQDWVITVSYQINSSSISGQSDGFQIITV